MWLPILGAYLIGAITGAGSVYIHLQPAKSKPKKTPTDVDAFCEFIRQKLLTESVAIAYQSASFHA